MTQEYRQLAKGLSVGIIMDGNGRWAKQRGLPRTAGHKKGAEVFRDMVHYCNELELASVTFYAFSTENWARPLEEVESIMRLFGNYLTMAYDYKKENNRLVFLGDRSRLSKGLQQKMDDLEEKTKNNTGTFLNIAINYGGRQEILHAAQVLAQRVKDGALEPQQITEELFSDNLYTHGQKDPDFILRPSGEMRLSNFMLWQCAYSEFVLIDDYWPDFGEETVMRIIKEYSGRERRFGGLK